MQKGVTRKKDNREAVRAVDAQEENGIYGGVFDGDSGT